MKHMQEGGVYDVVDGKQRLTTLIFFSDPDNFKSADGGYQFFLGDSACGPLGRQPSDSTKGFVEISARL
jgi:hypothetical protein